MPFRRVVPVMLGVWLASACLDTPTGLVCTAEAIYGLTAAVSDSVTGLPAAAEASAVIRAGGYEEVLNGIFGNDLHLVGAVERAGVYDLSITKAGYQDWVRGGITVTAGPCHVIPVIVDVKLQPTT